MIQNQNFTSIGKNTKLQGYFFFQGPTHLLGNLEGEIESDGKIVLDINSKTNAKIKCIDLDIYGHFTGEIDAKGLVVIYPTAFVDGKLKSLSLEILPGAQVNITGHTIL